MAIASAILANNVQKLGLDPETTDSIINDPAGIYSALPLSPTDRARAIDAYVRGFRVIFLTLAGGAVISFLSSLLMEQRSLRRADDVRKIVIVWVR